MLKRYYLLFWMALMHLGSIASAQKLTFSYDASGNQTERRWVCINCPVARSTSLASSKISSTDSGGELVSEVITSRSLKISPNPVEQTLRVMWKTPDKLYINKIEIFSMSGVRVYGANYKQDQREDQIFLSKLPPGAYILVGYYSDNKTETIKLIKI
ncbi:T9SS type A sorting domain-containing protein [Mucilaginibacter terrae]|uniref:T9SS type A sorting domain-containing protein n=1 Tax=Mucilaginibacter terrae TaxID=1955052 RepID=UPI00363B9574